MLNRDLEITLNLAFKEARNKRHEFMTVEHLLLALLDNQAAVDVLNACGADLDRLRRELTEFIDSTTPLIPKQDQERETQPTLGFQRVLQRAVFHVQSSGKGEVSGANVLVAIFSEQESQAVFFLKQQQIARIDIVNFISHGISKVQSDAEQMGEEQDSIEDEGGEGNAAAERAGLKAVSKLGKLGKLVKTGAKIARAQDSGPPPAPPGTPVSDHFAPIRATVQEVDGQPPLLDDAVAALTAQALDELRSHMDKPLAANVVKALDKPPAGKA